MSQFFGINTPVQTQQTSGRYLAANEIHDVKFEGAEYATIETKRGPMNVLRITFSNESGTYVDTTFEPAAATDFARTETEFTNKEGKKIKIPQPSVAEAMILKLRHIIDAINPTVGAQINDGKIQFQADSFKGICDLFIQIVTSKKSKLNTETSIKLIANKDGFARFPYFAGLSKIKDSEEYMLYMRTNFVGKDLSFTARELEQAKKVAAAKPTDMSKVSDAELDLTLGEGGEDNDDLPF